ncbi:MAG: hypothetical protein M1831_002330 [Alyxoria varia]|nr:MAG: hypothetical protein M1831_002330 [Alyxoria varia]
MSNANDGAKTFQYNGQEWIWLDADCEELQDCGATSEKSISGSNEKDNDESGHSANANGGLKKRQIEMDRARQEGRNGDTGRNDPGNVSNLIPLEAEAPWNRLMAKPEDMLRAYMAIAPKGRYSYYQAVPHTNMAAAPPGFFDFLRQYSPQYNLLPKLFERAIQRTFFRLHVHYVVHPSLTYYEYYMRFTRDREPMATDPVMPDELGAPPTPVVSSNLGYPTLSSQHWERYGRPDLVKPILNDPHINYYDGDSRLDKLKDGIVLQGAEKAWERSWEPANPREMELLAGKLVEKNDWGQMTLDEARSVKSLMLKLKAEFESVVLQIIQVVWIEPQMERIRWGGIRSPPPEPDYAGLVRGYTIAILALEMAIRDESIKFKQPSPRDAALKMGLRDEPRPRPPISVGLRERFKEVNSHSSKQ